MTRAARAPVLTLLVLAAAMALPHAATPAARRLKGFVAPAVVPYDMYRYLSQINAPHQGRWDPGNDYLKEHVGDPVLEAKWTQLAAAVWSWPFYPDFEAMYLWIGLGALALWVWAAGLLGADALTAGWAPWTFVLLATAFAMQENLGRIIHPQVDCFPLLAFFFLSAKRTFDGRGARWGAAAGASFGLLAYLYPVYWIFSGACLGLLIAYAWLRRMEDPAAWQGFFAGLCVGGILSLPSLWQRHELSLTPGYEDILFQNGFLRTRFPPVGSTAVYLLAAGALAFWTPRGRRPFWVCCLLGGLLALNENVLTGLYIESGPTHFQRALSLLLLWTFFEGLAARLSDAGKRRLASLPVWGLAAAWLLLAQTRRAIAAPYVEEVARLQDYAPSLRWLSANAPKGSVVLAEESASSYVAAFTPDFPYVAGYAMVAMTPVAEVRARKLAELRYFGMRPEDVRAYASGFFIPFWGHGPVSRANRERAWLLILHMLGGRTPVPPNSQIPAPLLDALQKEYADVPKGDPFLGYEVDYVLWGPSEKALFPKFDPASRSELKKVYSDDQASVWRWAP